MALVFMIDPVELVVVVEAALLAFLPGADHRRCGIHERHPTQDQSIQEAYIIRYQLSME